ncbi:hypothetical protein [Candidatus Flexifilum breve]
MYTGSIDAVFDGTPIRAGDESSRCIRRSISITTLRRCRSANRQ